MDAASSAGRCSLSKSAGSAAVVDRDCPKFRWSLIQLVGGAGTIYTREHKLLARHLCPIRNRLSNAITAIMHKQNPVQLSADRPFSDKHWESFWLVRNAASTCAEYPLLPSRVCNYHQKSDVQHYISTQPAYTAKAYVTEWRPLDM